MHVIDLFDRATTWTQGKIASLTPEQLDAQTPCEDWDVRALLNHLLAGQRMFVRSARGEERAAPPSGQPPDLVGDDPAAQFEAARRESLDAFRAAGDDQARLIGIAFADSLIHGWDLAKATGQDATMPGDLAAAAYGLLEGRISDEARGPGKPFAPGVEVAADASAQDKLVAYCGRTP